MSAKISKHPLLIIEWRDATAQHNWVDEKECATETPSRAYSVGWRIPSPKDCVALTSLYSEGNRCNDRIIIPKGCIKSIRRIE